jgi:Ca-activated chloride channel family protein
MFRKAWVVPVAIVLAVSGCTSTGGTNANDPNDLGDLKGCIPVVTAVSSEKVNLITKLADDFKGSPEGKAVEEKLGKCAAIIPRDVASGEATRLLKLGWPKEETIMPAPALWSPASSSWVAEVTEAQGSAMVPNPKSFARTPVVMALPEQMAHALGWPDKAIGLKDLHDLCLNPKGWSQYGGVEGLWGSFKLGKTTPTTSTTGRNILMMQNYAAANKTKGLTEADITAGTQFSKEFESCVIHYGDTTGSVLDRVYKRDQNNQPLNYVSAIAVEETSVINYNLGNPTSRVVKSDEQLTKPDQRLVAIYPSEGSLESDNPIVALGATASWVTPEQRTAAEAFVAFVQTPAAQSVLGNFGFRPVDPSAKPGGLVTLENGVDPTKPTIRLETPSVAVVSAATRQWNELRKPQNVLYLIDGSGSMSDPIGEGSDKSLMQGATESAGNTMSHFRGGDEVGVWVFTTNVRSDVGENISEIRKLSPLGGDGENLRKKLLGLQPANGTPLYDALSIAVKNMKENAQPGRNNAIILLSDGRDENSRMNLDDLLRELRGPSEGDDPAPVRVFPIVYGSKAPPEALRQIAEASGGQVFNATDPRRIDLVFKSVVNNF